MILKGVRVGRRAVVAANAVGTRDVPDFTVVAGVPARVIKVISPTDPLHDGNPLSAKAGF